MADGRLKKEGGRHVPPAHEAEAPPTANRPDPEPFDRVQVILDALPVPIFFKDAQCIYRGCNTAFERYLGRPRREIVGRSVEEIAPPELAKDYRQADEALLESRATQVYEARVRWADGGLRDVIFSKGVFFDDAGEVAGLAGTLLDITERKLADEALRRAQQRLQFADRLTSLGTLAAGVAHEINNPLAYVTANLKFALESLAGAAPLHVIEALSDAVEGAARISGIVRDMKTFSRAEDAISAVDVSVVLRSAANLARAQIGHRGKLVCDLDERAWVLAGEARLGQVFLNLLVNAAQALPDRASDLNLIRLVSRVEDDTVVVVVEDNGVGIPAAVRDRIFDPFFTTKPAGEGTGLGLAICHDIVTSLKGTIDVESEPGRFTVFRVRLPAASDGVVRRATAR
jgi:two-component system NtrC family sensor kinase